MRGHTDNVIFLLHFVLYVMQHNWVKKRKKLLEADHERWTKNVDNLTMCKALVLY